MIRSIATYLKYCMGEVNKTHICVMEVATTLTDVVPSILMCKYNDMEKAYHPLTEIKLVTTCGKALKLDVSSLCCSWLAHVAVR